jgi:hypothetical protein
MDNLEFLDSPEGGNDAAQPVETPVAEAAAEAPAEPTPEPESETAEQKATRERDEKGRFKAKEEDKSPVMVPLTALHETRDEVKALKAQLAAMQQPQQQIPQVPDMFGDPDGYTAYIHNEIAATALNDRLNLSEEMVRQSSGDDVVNAAQEWGKRQFAANPALLQQFYQQRNPYGFLVQQYQRQQLMAELNDADPKEIEAFKAWKAAQAQLQQQQPAQAEIPTQSAPPKSIASATSAGGMQSIAMGPTAAFDEIFQGR